MTFVRIKPPKNKNQKTPQSICSGGVKIVVGGPGTEVKDVGVFKRIKGIGGDNIETSKMPFEVVAPKGGIIDLDAMEMKAPPPAEEPVEERKK